MQQDLSPVRQMVRELMRRPVVTAAPDLAVSEAAQIMKEQKVSSVVVVREGLPTGIVTATDLVGKVLAAGRPPTLALADVMSTPVDSVGEEATYYEALLHMIRRGIKHLPVTDGSKSLVGMVTLGDLARSRRDDPVALVRQLERAPSVEAIASLIPGLDRLMGALVNEAVPPFQALSMISEVNDTLFRRLVELGIAKLGDPPCAWCWLQMGSAGRREQFTRSDQDHALIYTGESSAVDGYFAALAAFVVEGMERAGFARCPGDVMPTNPAWRRSLRDWQFQVVRMVNRPGGDEIRQATILLDFRPVAGEKRLAEALLEQVWVAVESVPLFLYHLVQDNLSHGVPIGPFRTIRTPWRGKQKGQLNLKADACVHVVDLLRALSLKHRVAETATSARLRALRRLGVIGTDEADWLETAYQTLMRLRMQDAYRQMQAGETPRAHLVLATLTQPEREALKDALVAVARFQEAVGSALAPGGAR